MALHPQRHFSDFLSANHPIGCLRLRRRNGECQCIQMDNGNDETRPALSQVVGREVISGGFRRL